LSWFQRVCSTEYLLEDNLQPETSWEIPYTDPQAEAPAEEEIIQDTEQPIDRNAALQQLPPDTTPETYAETLLSFAQQAEPQTTQDLTDIGGQVGGQLAGLDKRLKTSESTTRKLNKRFMLANILSNVSMAEVATSVNDALRYTVVLPIEQYTDGIYKAVQLLLQKGYSPLPPPPNGLTNYWKSEGYKGVNGKFVAPTGCPLEVQFHTADTLRVKDEKSYRLYEVLRQEQDINRKQMLTEQIEQVWEEVGYPPFIDYLDDAVGVFR